MSQVLDASAIKEVRDMAFSTLLEERLSSADCPAVALPESVRIHSLENLQDRRFRFRGKMETASILDFSRYCKDYAGEGVRSFINADNMSAVTDKTDIPELRRFNFEIWPHEAYISEQYDGEYVLFADANQQFEAERQRAGTRIAELEKRLRYTEETLIAANDLLTAAEKERDALKSAHSNMVTLASASSTSSAISKFRSGSVICTE